MPKASDKTASESTGRQSQAPAKAPAKAAAKPVARKRVAEAEHRLLRLPPRLRDLVLQPRPKQRQKKIHLQQKALETPCQAPASSS